MLKYSVQSRLFAILWALKTIHKEEPMYAVLDKVQMLSLFAKTNDDKQ